MPWVFCLDEDFALIRSTLYKHQVVLFKNQQEKANLQAAVDEIKVITMEFDVRVLAG